MRAISSILYCPAQKLTPPPTAGKWPQICEWKVIWLIILLKCMTFSYEMQLGTNTHPRRFFRHLQCVMLSGSVGSSFRAEVIWQVQTEGESWEWIWALIHYWWLCTPTWLEQEGHNYPTLSFLSCPSPWLCLKAWQAQYGCRKVTKHMRIKCLHNIVYQDAFIWLTAYYCLLATIICVWSMVGGK